MAITGVLRRPATCWTLAGVLLVAFQGPARAADGTNASNALVTKYLPAITSALSTFNPEPLALVDTDSNRKHVLAVSTGGPGDGIACVNSTCTDVPSKYFLYLGRNQIAVPTGGLTNPCPPDPSVLSVASNKDAGYTHAVAGSTSTRYLQFVLASKPAPNGEPSVGTGQIWYRISTDGQNWLGGNPGYKQLIASGKDATGQPLFTACHPLPGVRVNRNGAQFSGNTLIVSSNQGRDVLLPLTIAFPLTTDTDQGTLYNPYNAQSYGEVHVLRGHWHDDNAELDWTLGDAAQLPLVGTNPALPASTRGLEETAIVELATGGRCLIVSRGSNDGAPTLPGYYWVLQSEDGCRTWKTGTVTRLASPLGWDDGSPYFAPAAPPFLYKDSNNRIIFMGAITEYNSNGNYPYNSDGNYPRTRVIAAELDYKQLKLLKRSAVIVDDRNVAFDRSGVRYGLDLIYGNAYYPQGNGSVFYYTTRWDSGYCTDTSNGRDCQVHHVDVATSLLGGADPYYDYHPFFPANWHLLNPIPTAYAAFALKAGAAASNRVQWPSVPNAAKYLIYARNSVKQNFWDLNGEADGTATGYTLQRLPAGPTQVNVFAVKADGSVLSSSSQITTTFYP